jgi:hypothetical protein
MDLKLQRYSKIILSVGSLLDTFPAIIKDKKLLGMHFQNHFRFLALLKEE